MFPGCGQLTGGETWGVLERLGDMGVSPRAGGEEMGHIGEECSEDSELLGAAWV